MFSSQEKSYLIERAAAIPALLKKNLATPIDRRTPVFIAGADYRGIWIEHNQDCLFVLDIHPEAAWESQKIFMDFQLANGLIPYSLRLNPLRVNFAQLQTVWPFARCALEIAKKLKRPEEDFDRIYRTAAGFDNWLMLNRCNNPYALPEMFCAFDTGHDNSRRVTDGGIPNQCPELYAANMPECSVMPIISVDLAAMRFGALTALAEMAVLLDRPDAEIKDWNEKAVAVKEAIHAQLWDPEDEFFYDRSRSGLRKYRTEHITRLFLNRVIEPKLFDRIYNRYFADENEFFTAAPFPAVSVSDPSFNREMPHNCWGANTQALTLLRALLWMDHYGRGAELEEIMRRYLAAYIKFENPFTQELNPFTGAPIGNNPSYTPAMLFFLESCRRLQIIRED